VSFLVDPPLLLGSGAAIEATVDDERLAHRLESAVLAVFLITSISLYCNAPWTRWLARLCRADTGRDWMLNSGVFHIDHERAGPGTHLAAALTFLTYPLWIRLGRQAGRRLS
jgi:hypothetical protein